MKRITFCLLMMALAISSCKKSWQCGCIAPNDATRIIEIKAATKHQAENKCEAEALDDEGCCLDCKGG